jgi:ADP-L-glycero-D-manno-heptose 6-epimerase
MRRQKRRVPRHGREIDLIFQGTVMYVVTGGAGMIGSAVIWRLNKAGITDILVVDNLANTEKWRNLVNLRYTDYMHRDEFRRMMREKSADLKNIRAIVHMGACSSTTERNADYLMDNNFHYTQDVCKTALAANARFVYASSAATYGDGSNGFDDMGKPLNRLKPLNMYGYSKHLFDLWAERENLLSSIVGLKFFNVYGPNEYHKGDMRSVACKAFKSIGDTGKISLFASDHRDYADGGQKRDFIYVKDCAEVIYWLLENPQVNGLFNMGTGLARTWNDLAHAVFTAMDMQPIIKYVDMPEPLCGKYQYFTEAPMQKFAATGCPLKFHSLEQGIMDYVRVYLATTDPYL